ncbi:MAG: PAS domain-containing protein, partial [Gaiellaceae bacterium]
MAGLAVLWVASTSNHMTPRVLIAVLALSVGWSFIASGLVAWGRRPENRTGPLMVLVGFAWFLNAVTATDNAWLFSLSVLFGDLFLAIFVHLLIAFPSGRLHGRLEKIVVWSAYVTALAARVILASIHQKPFCDRCPRDTLAFWGSDSIASALTVVFDLSGFAIMVATVVILARHRRAASAAARRVLDPVLITGTITLVFVGLGFALEPVAKSASNLSYFVGLIAFVTVPLFFLAGLVRFRLARAAAGELLQEVSETPTIEEAQEGLRRALHDPTLELAWWVPETAGYVDQEGHPFTPVEGPGRAVTPVRHEGEPLAVVVHDAALLDEPELLNGVLAAARLALLKDRLQAELLARLVELERQRDYIAVLVNAAPAFFCVIDLEGRIVRFNDTLIAASGTPDDEAVRGRPFWDVFVSAEDAESTESAILSAAPGEHEHRWQARGGRSLVVAWSLTRVADVEGRERLLLTGIDVSDRARHEEELQRQRDFLTIVGNQSPALLCVVDSAGTVADAGVNRAFTTTTGFDDDTALGHPFWELIAAPEHAEAIRAAFL